MAGHTPVKATAKQVETAQTIWSFFVKISKWVIIATCVIVVLLGVVFIDW